MSRLRINFAANEYDHFRDLIDGDVQATGIEINHLKMQVEEIFYRFVNFLEWELSEMSMGKFVAFMAMDNGKVIGLPVFPSRVFRQSSVFVRRDGPLKRPEDLRGRRVGIPEWAQTAAIYTRGWLVHQVGIPLADIDWVQSGVTEPGREEKVELRLPAGVAIERRTDKSLTDLLLDGDIDAVASAHPPPPFEAGAPDIVQLVPDWRSAEEAYYRETGVFPIMHIVAMRRDFYEANPWIAMNLYKAFLEAKRRSLARCVELTMSHFPFAWSHAAALDARRIFGDDFFPYGLEANRTTLEAFLQYAYEQGVCHRRLAPEELFPKELSRSFKV